MLDRSFPARQQADRGGAPHQTVIGTIPFLVAASDQKSARDWIPGLLLLRRSQTGAPEAQVKFEGSDEEIFQISPRVTGDGSDEGAAAPD